MAWGFFYGVRIWGVKYKHISWFIFSPYFYSKWGGGGQAGGEIWVYIEFIVARLPTLQIGVQKVAKMPENFTP
jgi:hypothetical protein